MKLFSFLFSSSIRALTDYEISRFGCREGKVYQFHKSDAMGGEKIG